MSTTPPAPEKQGHQCTPDDSIDKQLFQIGVKALISDKNGMVLLLHNPADVSQEHRWGPTGIFLAGVSRRQYIHHAEKGDGRGVRD